MASETSSAAPHWLRRWLLACAFVLALLWLTFFDSHSLVKRITWHQELARVSAENQALEGRIQEFEEKLEAAASERVVEQIAREQYGMRRAGETVYRVERESGGESPKSGVPSP